MDGARLTRKTAIPLGITSQWRPVYSETGAIAGAVRAKASYLWHVEVGGKEFYISGLDDEAMSEVFGSATKGVLGATLAKIREDGSIVYGPRPLSSEQLKALVRFRGKRYDRNGAETIAKAVIVEGVPV